MTYEYFSVKENLGRRVLDSNSRRYGTLIGQAKKTSHPMAYVIFDGEEHRTLVEKRYLVLKPQP